MRGIDMAGVFWYNHQFSRSRGKMKFENHKKPCIICKAPSFLRTDKGRPLCPIHFIMYGSTDEVTDGADAETSPFGNRELISQTGGI